MIVDEKLIKSPKISIIITYFNLGEFLGDCVLSILEQSYQNFEIIIVNDGSDNKNSEILKKFSDKRIKILSLEENKGQLCAFLEGLKIAQGEFICMVDADDILLKDYLKTLLYVHLNTNFAFISASAGEISQNGEITSLNYSTNKFKVQKNKINYDDIQNIFKTEKYFELKKNKNVFGLWSWNPSTSAMFRREALNILNFYPDYAFWKTGADKVIFTLLDLLGGSSNISAVCFLYRHHNLNNTQTTLSIGEKRILNEKYIDKLIDWNIKIRFDTIKMFIKNQGDLIKNYNIINYYRMLLRVIFSVNIKICAKIFKTFVHKFYKFKH